MAAPTSRATAAASAATATRLRDSPRRPRREISPDSSAGGTATAGPNTAAAAWRSRSAGSIGPTTRAARSSAEGGAVEHPPAAHQRRPQGLGGGPRRHQRDRPRRRLHRRGAGADGGGRRQRRRGRPGPAPAPPPAVRWPPPPARPRSPGAPATGGPRHPRRRSSAAPGSGESARASSTQIGSDGGRRRAHDQGRDKVDARLVRTPARPGRATRGRSAGRWQPDAPRGRCRRRRARSAARRRAPAGGRPRGCARPPPRPPGRPRPRAGPPAAGPRALRAGLQRGPGAPGVERLQHARAHLREGGGGDGEVVGAHGRAPGERGEVAQGRIDVADAVGRRRRGSLR